MTVRPTRLLDPVEVPLDRGNAGGRETRETIMVLAERHFAEHGIQGVSLRAIGQAAGQRNKTAVQYHFGDRLALVNAIYAFRSAQYNAQTAELLATHEASGAPDEPTVLLRILFERHIESVAEPDNHYVPFLARILMDVGSLRYDAAMPPLESVMETHLSLQEKLQRAYPAVPDDLFAQRFELLYRFGIGVLATHKRFGDPSDAPALDEIVAIMAAGLGAPHR